MKFEVNKNIWILKFDLKEEIQIINSYVNILKHSGYYMHHMLLH
jgi:hypothetical protein